MTTPSDDYIQNELKKTLQELDGRRGFLFQCLVVSGFISLLFTLDHWKALFSISEWDKLDFYDWYIFLVPLVFLLQITWDRKQRRDALKAQLENDKVHRKDIK